MSHEDHVQVGKNICDDLQIEMNMHIHTDRPMAASAVTPAKNDVMPIVQWVERDIIDDGLYNATMNQMKPQSNVM